MVRLEFCHCGRIDNQVATVCHKLQKAKAFLVSGGLTIECLLSGEPPEEEHDGEWFPAEVSQLSPLSRDL